MTLKGILLLATSFPLVAGAVRMGTAQLDSHFECKQMGNGYRPYYLKAVNGGQEFYDYSQTPKGLLGQGAMASIVECRRAKDAAHALLGVICSRTGLGGWKPTLYTGTRPGRPDFGYLGGSSIMRFEDCLKATYYSSERGVCFWGGSQWYVSPVDKAGLIAGPFTSIDECVDYTRN